MIKVLESQMSVNNEYICTIFADTKDEVTGTSLNDFLPDSKLSPGSIVLTGGWNVGILKSDGTWSWKE